MNNASNADKACFVIDTLLGKIRRHTVGGVQ
jgi:hypothetical protein